MKKILDWKSEEVVNIYDEVTLWSAPFGRLLLEQMPMQKGASVLDIGFGTGFPLIELSQRFGSESQIYGIDIWEAGIHRTREKIRIFEIEHIKILEKSATEIDMEDNQIEIVTSNLGVNNFQEISKVYREIRRVLKPTGSLCITTNPIGTFAELFEVFESLMAGMELKNALAELEKYVARRKDKSAIVKELEEHGIRLVKSKSDSTIMRFLDGEALLDHSLIRIAFRETWEQMIGKEKVHEFFIKLRSKIDEIVAVEGEFKMTIPMLYLEFEKA